MRAEEEGCGILGMLDKLPSMFYTECFLIVVILGNFYLAQGLEKP